MPALADPLPADDPLQERSRLQAEMGLPPRTGQVCLGRIISVASELVKPPRVAECSVQMEAVIEAVYSFGKREAAAPFGNPDDYTVAIEARVVRAHVEESILVPERQHRLLVPCRRCCWGVVGAGVWAGRRREYRRPCECRSLRRQEPRTSPHRPWQRGTSMSTATSTPGSPTSSSPTEPLHDAAKARRRSRPGHSHLTDQRAAVHATDLCSRSLTTPPGGAASSREGHLCVFLYAAVRPVALSVEPRRRPRRLGHYPCVHCDSSGCRRTRGVRTERATKLAPTAVQASRPQLRPVPRRHQPPRLPRRNATSVRWRSRSGFRAAQCRTGILSRR